MIRNLNQVSFQGFGNVPPERNQSVKLFEKSEAVCLTCTQENTIIYSAKADTWVTFDSGISVLSVSHDGENYQHFYLDKPVCISFFGAVESGKDLHKYSTLLHGGKVSMGEGIKLLHPGL